MNDARTSRPPPEPSERLTYTIPEASAILGISDWLGYELAKRGELPTVQLGRRKLVPRAALERMMAQAGQEWEDRYGHREASG